MAEEAGATTEAAGEWRHESGYILTNDPERVDLEALHRFLSTEAYWSVDITKERVALAVLPLSSIYYFLTNNNLIFVHLLLI
jgi:hypothetical protein